VASISAIPALTDASKPRPVPAEVNSPAAGGWQVAVGGDLSGRTLGLAGLGRIGSAMARIGRAFDMNVIAWSANLTGDRAAEAGSRPNPEGSAQPNP
jgi:phosphoglycerate dehydrogenase-like enzyme